MRRSSFTLLSACLAGLLCGCTVGPNFSRPKAELPGGWAAQTVTAAGASGRLDTQTPPPAEWLSSFGDHELEMLIERSHQANLDLRAAVLRITEARAQRDVSAAALWPTLSANAGFTRERLSESTPTGSLFTRFNTLTVPGIGAISVPNPYNQYQLGLSASWELDVFGRVRRSVEAADADVKASIADSDGVRVSLDSDVAHAYMDLRGSQLRKSVIEASLRTDTELLELTQQREAAGLITDLDVENAAAERDSTRAQLPVIELTITEDIHQLSRLLGREPEALRSELETSAPVPPVPPEVPIGLPADLARHRPDIREAEETLHAATARIGIAVAHLFPRLTLNAEGGFQSQSVSDLIEWASRFESLGPTLEIPIFDRGRWATIHLQDVRAQEAALDYQRIVLAALHEVENALAAYRSDEARRADLETAAAHSRDALTLARQRYESGVESFIVVLDAERTLQQNQLALAESVTSVSADVITLYRTLGGGLPAV